jgi:hypothetical protein
MCRIQGFLKLLMCASAIFLFACPSRAITFHITYDPSVTSRSDYAQIQTAIAYTEREFSSLFTNNITINITITNDNTISGGESFENYIPTTYTAIRNALAARANTADDFTSVASLPASDPTSGGIFTMARPEAKALGLLAANSTVSDGVFGFGASDPWTYDPANRGAPGTEDFIGTAEHEFSELMGRNSDLGFYFANGFQPFDLFRFSAPGVRSFDLYATNAYFSIDGGVTDLKMFNPQGNGGDDQDWNLVSNPPDAFDAYGVYGAETPMTALDIRVMDILGFGLNRTPSRITGFTLLPNRTSHVSGTGIVSQSYILLAATNPGLHAAWSIVDTNIAVLNGNFLFTDPQAATFKSRFYRVRTQ